MPDQAAPPEKEVVNDTDVVKFLATAYDRFDASATAFSDVRVKALDDIKFSHNDDNYQWPQVLWQDRIKWKRPTLTINQLPKFIRQVTNETRQNKPGILVHPVDDGADVDTAEVIQGLIRHIEYASTAQIAYNWASDNQVRGGFGYFRVLPDYCEQDSFEQELKIKRVKNPFTVYFDPDAIEPDYSDARYCFVTEDMSVQKYRELYPDSKLASLSNYTAQGNTKPWANPDNIRVAEYFYFVAKEKTIYLLHDGSVTDQKPEDKTLIANERKTQIKQQKWAKINALEVLEEQDIPIPWIPVIPVLGEECDVDGKKLIKGMVRDAQDSQRQYNYMRSAATEAIALAPKAPFVAAEGQIENYEDEWQSANVENYSVLTYKPQALGGTLVPAPRRESTEPAIQAMVTATRESAEELKAVTGIYDASLGARSNETSGKAIQARQAEGDTANYHYADNLALSIMHLGRILVAWIPHIYDAPRSIRILGEDDSAKSVVINQASDKNGGKIYDLTAGTYDVAITVGPSFSTKRQQATDTMVSISQAVPELWKVAGDLIVKQMDWPGAQQLAKRLKLFLPPEVQKEEAAEEKQPIPPEVQQQLAQMNQMIEQLTQQLNAAHDEIQTKGVEGKVKLQQEEMKTELGYARIKADLMIAQMNLQSSEDKMAFQHEMQMIDHKMQLLHKDIDSEAEAMAFDRDAVAQSDGANAESSA